MDRLKLPGILAAGLLAWQAVALANSPARRCANETCAHTVIAYNS
jgi:hypothetical protein